MARKSHWYEMDKELEQCHNLVINTTRFRPSIIRVSHQILISSNLHHLGHLQKQPV